MIKFDDGELKDILPSNFTRQPQVVAISYALKQEYDRYLLCLVRAYVYASIDTAEDDVLDYLATDFRFHLSVHPKGYQGYTTPRRHLQGSIRDLQVPFGFLYNREQEYSRNRVHQGKET